MARKKGTPKTGGRRKGTPNRVTSEMRAWIEGLLYGSREQFERDLQDIEPRERVKVVLSLLQYVLPKRAAITPDGATLAEVHAVRGMLQGAPDSLIYEIVERLRNEN
ncbi:MAG: hypothetical protein IKX59_10785 [Bacteroidales bacterium]|nr:hypothetical protein [Bacteroidales bacterium]